MGDWRHQNPDYFKDRRSPEDRAKALWRIKNREYIKLHYEEYKTRHRKYMREYMRERRRHKKIEKKTKEIGL